PQTKPAASQAKKRKVEKLKLHGWCFTSGMSPTVARVVMTLAISAVVISAIILVNTRYHGSFLVGLFVIVLPFLVLSYVLPRLLPVRCPRCHARMRFRLSQID